MIDFMDVERDRLLTIARLCIGEASTLMVDGREFDAEKANKLAESMTFSGQASAGRR